MATLDGESPHAALSPEQILRNTMADATAIFQTQPYHFMVLERSLNSNILGQYSTYEQIPAEYLQLVMDGGYQLRIYYKMSSTVNFRVDVNLENNGMQSRYWRIYFVASYK